jgi:chromosome segregation ATPase
MPSINDLYNQLTTANSNLQVLHNDLAAIQTQVAPLDADIKAVNGTLSSIINELSNLINLINYTNNALFHVSQQNDTVICNLEKISNNTCSILNEAHVQTKLQTSLRDNLSDVLEITKLAHSEAALELENAKKLKEEIERCCPPKVEGPICHYTPCEKPTTLEKPPQTTEPTTNIQ